MKETATPYLIIAQRRLDEAGMKRRSKQNLADDEPVTVETVRELVRELPGVIEGASYGTPAFRAGKALFVRQHQDGESLVVRMDHDQRAVRMRAAPETFYITDHYLNYPWVLVRLAAIDREDLRDLLEEAWRLSSPGGLASPSIAKPKSKPARSRTPPGRKGSS
jgi:hypothetical protein